MACSLVVIDSQAFRRYADCYAYRVYILIGCELSAVKVILLRLTYDHDLCKIVQIIS